MPCIDYSSKSTMTIAVTDSSTGGIRNAMHKSCLPFTEKDSTILFSTFNDC